MAKFDPVLSKEKQKATALNQHLTCRGFAGDEIIAPSGYSGSITLTARQKYSKYFTEADLRAGTTCMLCGSTIIEEWGRHVNFSMHRLSMSIFLTIFENCRFRSAQEITDAWITAALVHENGNTIRPLVSTDMHVLKRRLWELLLFLQKHRVLKESLNFAKGRTFLFDQAEWIGDVAIPPLLFDAFSRVFDFEAKESIWKHVFGEIGVLFGNPHLEATFDFLELHRVIADGEKVVQGKTKSDFVEALAGELKMFLLGAELDFSTSKQPCQVVDNQYSLYRIANHCLHVLVVMILMTFLAPAVDRVVEMISRINRAEGLTQRHVPKSSHIAVTLPQLVQSRRFLSKKATHRSSVSQSEAFALSREKISRSCAARGLQNLRLESPSPYEFTLEESSGVLPVVFEDSKLYDMNECA